MAFSSLKSAMNFSIAIYLTSWLLISLQLASCTPVTTTNTDSTGHGTHYPASNKVVKTPTEWLQGKKPPPNPNTPGVNAVMDQVYAQRPHSPRRASVAAQNRPIYDLSRQKAYTYGRMDNVVSFGIKHGKFSDNKKQEMGVTRGVVNDLKLKYHDRAEALLPHH
ncbi:uncharacterized protein FA14DRAFT_185029 [Meira miltonrushii]|uniref:Uncharacterized protein n=1 Tax=Meira miltonrushii TaxID=1280837 RepID=A0A316VAF7_9BASI|nr:uncharacterized protein FA14DRAFT_185029 [Meira miltonrushii]PWN33173.1 hypothetical protein FA14DRAFT_185029 [Meira miltonrushii]